MVRKNWTDKDIEMLMLDYADTPTEILAKKLAATESAVYQKAYGLGLRKTKEYISKNCRWQPGSKVGASYQFPKGNRPHNAGKKGWQAGGNSKKTQFKPGHRGGRAAAVYKPVGSERTTEDGYLERKVNDDMPFKRRWKAVHHIVWEESNGPIPKGYIVVFKNGDKQDIRLNNLELISRAENMNRNTVHRLPKELAQVCQLKGALQRQINKRMGNEKQD